jgi:hypothetical protein
MHGRSLAGQIIQTCRQPFKVIADPAVDLRIDKSGGLPYQACRTFFLDRFQQLPWRILPEQPVNIHQMLAEKTIKTITMRRKMVVSIPPEPVASFGCVQGTTDNFGGLAFCCRRRFSRQD